MAEEAALSMRKRNAMLMAKPTMVVITVALRYSSRETTRTMYPKRVTGERLFSELAASPFKMESSYPSDAN
jgi:hypothetical protein